MFSEYTDTEAILSSLNMRLEIISAIQENKSDQARNEKLLELFKSKSIKNLPKRNFAWGDYILAVSLKKIYSVLKIKWAL